MSKDLKKEINYLKKEINSLKKTFRKKYSNLLTELQDIGYKYNYEFVVEEEPLQKYLDTYYDRLVEKVTPKKIQP